MWDWEIVCDHTRDLCQSWQAITFPARPVVFVRIIGTHNTMNEVFHCVHFECPNQAIITSKSGAKSEETKVGQMEAGEEREVEWLGKGEGDKLYVIKGKFLLWK